MTNLVYGFLEIDNQGNKVDYISLVQKKIKIGISEIRPFQLSNFPDNLFYEYNKNCISFCLGDKPGKNRASYLLDFIDYAKNADIGMPYKAIDRVEILIESIFSIITSLNLVRIVIALTDSCEIEELKKVKLENLKKEIISDFETLKDVPGKIYDVQIK